jgi:hypothetical protein
MSVFGTKNMMNVFVGKSVTGTAIASITLEDPFNTSTGIADGQIIAVGTRASDGKEVVIPTSSNTAAAYPYWRAVMRQGNQLFYGPRIKSTEVSFGKTASYTAPKEQVWSVGFTGHYASTDTIDVTQGNEFMLTIAYDHDDMMWSEQKLRNTYDYYSQAPTSKDVAISMATQINYKERLGLANGTGRMVKSEIFNSGTAAAINAITTLTVANGSDIITFGVASTDNVAKNLIRIGFNASATDPDTGASLNSGTASGRFVNLPVYTIVESNNTASASGSLPAYSARINMAYQGPSAAVATANAGVIATAGTYWGFTVSGLPLTWQKDFFKYNKVKFHFDTKGFGATTFTKTGSTTDAASPTTTYQTHQESSKGVGYYQEVAEYESFAAGFEGVLNRMKVPIPSGRNFTDTTTPATYTTTAIESLDNALGSINVIEGSNPMRVQQFFFFPTANTGNKDKFASQLSSIVGTL